MAEVIYQPTKLDVKVSPGDTLELFFNIIDVFDNPIDISSWVLTGEYCSVDVTDAPGGKFKVTIKTVSDTRSRWGVLRSGFKPRRILAGERLVSVSPVELIDQQQEWTLQINELDEITIQSFDEVFSQHTANNDNPHQTTFAQVGAEPDGAVAEHNIETAGVHGIDDTSLLITHDGTPEVADLLRVKTIDSDGRMVVEKSDAISGFLAGDVGYDDSDNTLVVGADVQAALDAIEDGVAGAIEDLEKAIEDALEELLGGLVGQVASFAMNTPPDGWLECNGSDVSRETYSSLFNAIGTTFGVGDGSTTFGLPDLRGEFVRGWDNGRGVDSGRTFGSAQAQAFLSHSHNSGNLSTSNTGAHSHTYTGPNNTNGGDTAGNGVWRGTVTASTSNTGAHSHNVSGSVGATGGGETRPRNIALMYCIKY